MLEERNHRVEHLATIEDVNRRRTYLREQMLEDLGGFPDRTPLNARVVGVLERTGYRIEKIIFDSQPHFYVTANLYLPTTGRPPYPAILFPLGHERGGKTNPTWQQMLGSLATKGFVALAWDPVGQGERLQIFDEDLRESKVGNSTTEHTVVGTQCMLVGDHLARYTIWDGMRALDYLLTRKEVDPARIGLTGNSGGGTHTAYIAALDDRIQVAAPSCYITSWHLMLDTIGPQDAEQTFPFWLQEGLRQTRDLLLLVIIGLSWVLTSRDSRRLNDFNWFPIVEVGKLFAAIFVTIVPAIAILRAGRDGALAPLVDLVGGAGEPNDIAYFWLTGVLSSFLDNAPTYLVFFNLAGGDAQALMGPLAPTLKALSMAAVYFGALTYIGNAPNFMIKAIAEDREVAMPSFFAYFAYAAALLVPLLLLVSVLAV